jgi:hypothetical protein
MSMWVRLVGGLGNGEVRKVDDDQAEIIFRINVRTPMSVRAFNPSRSIVSDTVDVKMTRYTRRIVKTPGGDVTFFAVEAFSDFEALHHVLGP